MLKVEKALQDAGTRSIDDDPNRMGVQLNPRTHANEEPRASRAGWPLWREGVVCFIYFSGQHRVAFLRESIMREAMSISEAADRREALTNHLEQARSLASQ